MTIDAAKVDLVLQYALLVAGQEDDFKDRSLGPIHLIKYAYLADLEFASRGDGVPFTGAEWTFYKFGPWCQAIHSRIEPALKTIQAERFSAPSDYGDKDDWVRWSKCDNGLLEKLEASLPYTIKGVIRGAVHRYTHDTAALLDFVYKTAPMLEAAPGERLAFKSIMKAFPTRDRATPEVDAQLSDRQRKKLKEKMRTLKDQLTKAKSEKPKMIRPEPPRYDAVFNDGIKWLENSAGQAFEEKRLTVEFDDEVWKSSTRNGQDLP